MKKMINNALFWQKVDTLIMSNNVNITKHAGDSHDSIPGLIYPVDFGYVQDTTGTGNRMIEAYQGSANNQKLVEAMIVSCNILDKDIEVKLLINCDEEEISKIVKFLNSTDFQKALLIRRGSDVPEWDDE